MLPIASRAGSRTISDEINSVSALGWVRAFTVAFSSIEPNLLDGHKLLRAASLSHAHVAIVYDDGTGRVSGRIYSVDDLNGSNRHQFGPVATVTSFILSEIVEPSAPGAVYNHPLLSELNEQFPGVGWFGYPPGVDT